MVGESELLKLKGKYIRIAHKDLGSTIEIIGNIIKDNYLRERVSDKNEYKGYIP